MRLLLILLLSLGGGAIWSPLWAQTPVAVRTVSLEEIADYPLHSAPAMAVSINRPVISAELAATVQSVAVRVGDIVEQDTPLVNLDCSNYDLMQRQASALQDSLLSRVELAEKRLQRTQSLQQQDSASLESLDERMAELNVIRAELVSAEAALQRARLDQSRCRIVSPFHAVVSERNVSVGEYVAPGTPLVSLVGLDELEISAQVPNSDIAHIQTTDTLFFAFAGRTYPLDLKTILPLIDTNTRNQEIRLLFNTKPAIAGAAGKLFWKDPRPHVPADLLVERGGELGIFIETGGIARFHAIAGARPGRNTAVDLPVDTRIISEGHYALADNTAVRPAD